MVYFKESYKAIEEIDEDLAMFQDHLEGTDADLKELAGAYTIEFTVCRDKIEESLISILDSGTAESLTD